MNKHLFLVGKLSNNKQKNYSRNVFFNGDRKRSIEQYIFIKIDQLYNVSQS